MKDCNEVPYDVRPTQKNEAQTAIAKMTNHIKLLGFDQPEKLAEGPCPHCHNMIVLWATAQGLELSLYNHTVELTSGLNDTSQDDSNAGREFFSKPIIDAPTPSHQSMKDNAAFFIKNPLAWLKARFGGNG